jgi:hypothetical protein
MQTQRCRELSKLDKSLLFDLLYSKLFCGADSLSNLYISRSMVTYLLLPSTRKEA